MTSILKRNMLLINGTGSVILNSYIDHCCIRSFTDTVKIGNIHRNRVVRICCKIGNISLHIRLILLIDIRSLRIKICWVVSATKAISNKVSALISCLTICASRTSLCTKISFTGRAICYDS